MYSIIMQKNYIGHHVHLKDNKQSLRYRAQLEGNFFCCVRARANLRALMTQKSCVVGMRNAILRNHLNQMRVKNGDKTLKWTFGANVIFIQENAAREATLHNKGSIK